MTIRRTHRRLALEIAQELSDSAARAHDESNAVAASVDATRAASRSALGKPDKRAVVSGAGESRVIEARQSFAQIADSAVLEIRNLLSRMRQIAFSAEASDVTGGDRQLLVDEFTLLQGEVDQVAAWVELRPSTVSTAGAFSSVPGVMDDDDRFRGLMSGLTAESLKLDSKHATVETAKDASWALFRVDVADETVVQIRDEFGTVEERIDLALSKLSEFIDSLLPSSDRPTSPSAALEVAERSRLQVMHAEGISLDVQAKGLQQSVTALLQ